MHWLPCFVLIVPCVDIVLSIGGPSRKDGGPAMESAPGLAMSYSRCSSACAGRAAGVAGLDLEKPVYRLAGAEGRRVGNRWSCAALVRSDAAGRRVGEGRHAKGR